MEYDVGSKDSVLAKVLTGIRWFIMVCIYVSATAVVCSVFTIEHPQGKEMTPPISPTMQCVINLSFQYFLIYILVWAFITFEHFTPKDWHFAPMLCVLFIATRMRALQITQNKGAPQRYVQD